MTISAYFQQLEDDGVVYVLNRRYMLPYVYLRVANRTFTSVPPQLLPAPGVQYSWSDFEKLEHALQVRADRSPLRSANVPISEFGLKYLKKSGNSPRLAWNNYLKAVTTLNPML